MPRRRATKTIGAALAAPIVVLVAALTFAPAAQPAQSAAKLEAAFVASVNRTRVEHGREPLQLDQRLRSTARGHTADMLERNYFAHGAFAWRIARSGAPGDVVGENLGWIAAHNPTPVRTIVRMWMRSAMHRAVLLRPGFERFGVGVSRGPFRAYESTIVVTADFSGS